MIPDKGKFQSFFIKSRDDGIRPVGKPDVVSQIDRAADDKERERQRKHGDEQKPAPQAFGIVRRRQTISSSVRWMLRLAPSACIFFADKKRKSMHQLCLLCRWEVDRKRPRRRMVCASPGVPLKAVFSVKRRPSSRINNSSIAASRLDKQTEGSCRRKFHGSAVGKVKDCRR